MALLRRPDSQQINNSSGRVWIGSIGQECSQKRLSHLAGGTRPLVPGARASPIPFGHLATYLVTPWRLSVVSRKRCHRHQPLIKDVEVIMKSLRFSP